MPLKLYNTLTRKKEIFKSLKKGKVGMYVCGPTVYDYVHIGNLRAYVFADILRRVLKLNNYDMKHVMNITDIDDKTIRDSQKKDLSLHDFTKKYEEAFLEDMNKMNIERPEIMPHATDHIKEMVLLVSKLLEENYAYKADDGIYFSIKKFKDYGKLSRIKKQELISGASKRILKDEYDKEDVNDFVLWKFYTKEDGEVYWNTKLGKGRPGWHIECSAMSSKYLGEHFDIHVGGIDLIFPHHENEIAQSEAAFGVKPWVRYWLHNEWVLVNGKKMSKSLGNFYKLRDLVDKGYSPMHLRYFYLSGHYKKPLNFTWKNLETAKKSYERLKNIVFKIKKSKQKKNKKNIESANKQFLIFLNDDLNTSRALAYMWEILRDNKLNDAEKFELISYFDKVFGLDLAKEEKTKISEEIGKLIDKREKARKEKDFKHADEIREEIREKGFIIEDSDKSNRVRKI